jgi:hypothetical protein
VNPPIDLIDGGDVHIIINEADSSDSGAEMGIGIGPVAVGSVGEGINVGVHRQQS